MNSAPDPRLLRGYRRWFLLDGVVTGANALAYLVLHRLLPDLLGSTPIFYIVIGVILAIVTVGLFLIAGASRRPRVMPELLAGINAAWAVASFIVALSNPFELSTIGIIWAAVQGLVVLTFSIVQFRSLRGTRGGGMVGGPRELNQTSR